jgi:hypothetical protein
MSAGAEKRAETVLQAGMTTPEREARRHELQGLEQLAVPLTGNPAVDGPRLRAALALIPEDKRAAAVAGNEAAMAQLDRVDAKGLTAEEAGGVVERLATAGKNPAAVQAAFAGLSPEQRRQVIEEYRKSGKDLEADFPADALPDEALSPAALGKRMVDKGGMTFIAQAHTGNQEADAALIRQGLVLLSPEKRAQAIAQLPPEQRALGERLSGGLDDAEKIRAAGGDPKAIDAVMAGKSPAERNAILAMSNDESLAKYGAMTPEETAAAASSLKMKDGKLDPAAVKAAFAGLTAEQRAALAEEIERQTGGKLESLAPPSALPNDLLSPEGLAAKLEPQRMRDWVTNLPPDKRDAAIDALPPDQQAQARRTVTGIEEGAKLKELVKPIDESLSPEEKEKAKKAQDEAVEKFYEGKSAAERNAILKETGIQDAARARLSADETRIAADSLKAAGGDPAAVKAIFDGLTPAQAAQIAALYEKNTGHRPEQDMPATTLPVGALSMEARAARSPEEIIEGLKTAQPTGDPAKDAEDLHANLMAIKDDKQRAAAIEGLPAGEARAGTPAGEDERRRRRARRGGGRGGSGARRRDHGRAHAGGAARHPGGVGRGREASPVRRDDRGGEGGGGGDAARGAGGRRRRRAGRRDHGAAGSRSAEAGRADLQGDLR